MLTVIAAAIGLVMGVLLGYLIARRSPKQVEQGVTGTQGAAMIGTPVVAELVEDGGEAPAEPVAAEHEDDGGERATSVEEELRQAVERISELETELRRFRRRAGEQLTHVAADLAARWLALKLPRRVRELPQEVDADVLAELEQGASRVAGWVNDFGLGSAEIHYQLGLIAALAGRTDDAARRFEQAAFDGLVPDGWLAAADSHWRLARPKKAARLYQRCLEHKRMPEHIFLRCAEVAIVERRYHDALEVLTRIMGRKSVEHDAFLLAARANHLQGNNDQTIELCERGLEQYPDSVLLLTEMIVPLAQRGDGERAVACAERARELDPENAAVPFAIGVMHLGDGREAEAAELFEEALILRPEYPEALCSMGVIHNRKGEYSKALECFKPAVKLKPDYADAYFNMKESYEGLRDFDNAIAMLNRAVQLNSDYA